MNPTLRQLEAFLAVARTLSFSKASQQVHLSQPGLSGAVRKLEETIGARLFDRDTRNVILTPAGSELLVIADDLLNNFDFALDRVRDYLGGKRGRIAIAAAPSLAAGFLPEVIASFQRTYPGIALQLHDTFSERCIEMVHSGKVDLALTPEKRSDPDLSHRDLFRESFVLFLRADHPLAKQRTVIWNQLAPLNHIVIRRSSSVREVIEGAFAKANITLRPAFEIEQFSTVIGLITSGLGVAVLPHGVIKQAALGPVVHRRITKPEIHREVCIITLKSRSLAPAAEAFVKTCLEHQMKLHADRIRGQAASSR
jgi:LysR family transcriptional regulator, carnitine catabolism transcriptional activator